MADANDQAAADAAAKAQADAKLAETNATIEKLKASGAKIYTDVEMKEAITRRQEALDKLRGFEEKEAKEQAERKKAEEDKLKKDGEYKTLLTTREQEIEKLRLESATYKEKADKADAIEKALREQTLAKITDPDLKRFGEKLPTADLLAYTEKITSGKVLPMTDKGQQGKVETDLSKFKDATSYLDDLRKRGLVG